MRLLSWLRFKPRIVFVPFLIIGMVATNIEVPPVSALTGLDFAVDYTPDSATVATSAFRGTKIDLTASTPVAIAGTTQQEIVQQVDPELDLRIASDITAPSGWTIYYSTDGNSWTANAPTTLAGWEALRYVKANGPLVSEGADASGRQISSSTATGLQPDNGQFSTANDSSGDGWDVFFDDMKHVYNIWHHRTGTGIDCHLRTGARCGGTWPYLLKSATNYNPNTAGTFEMAGSYNPTGWYDSVDKEIWIPTVYTRGISGVANSSVGFACISVADIAATNKWCGGSVTNGGFVSPGAGADFLTSQKCAEALYDCYQGLAASGDRIFTWNVKTGDLACIDIRLNSGAGAPCASGGLIDFGASLPDANTGGYFFASLGAWEGRIYGNVNDSNSAGYAVCIEASTGAACTGWTNPRATLGGQGRYTTLPGLAAGDPMRAACFLGIGIGLATRANCYNASGTDIAGNLTSEFLIGYDATQGLGAYSNYNPAHGTRMYWGSGSANAGKINCWDFALNGWCTNWTAAGITDTNYQISLDPLKPTCIWSNADDTIIQTYNATTGAAGNCAMPAPTVNFDGGMQLPRMACSSINAIQAWRTFTLITAVSYASAKFTVKNSSGTAIPAWTDVTVPANKIIDLASLSVSDTGQSPTFSVTFTDRTDEGDVSAKISAIGGSPELCLRPTVACPYPIVHPSQLFANSVTLTASGSTTANSVVSQFDSVARTVNIANTPTSSCATSLSGNLSTGAGAAVVGVLVTLTDTSGVVLTYPADYPDASLRGQAVTAVSDSSGNYSFPLVAAGNYKLKFVDASGSVLVNQAIVTASGSGMTSDYTAATSLLSPSITLVTGTPGVVNAKYNSSQSLSKVFWPTTVNAGQVSTLTFTISNTSMQSKSGIGWVDSLPDGLVVDDNPNKRTTCAGGSSETLNPSAMTAVAGATSISVTGASINANVASCTYSVNVKATAAGDYRNGPSNVTTTSIDKNTDATVEALAPPAPGATLCDNNVFYLESGQLYRHPYNSLSRYAVGPTYTSGAVDAIGYNSVDGFIYGIARSTTTSNGVALTAGHLVRYSSNGILTDLGSLTGSGITDTVMATAVGGDFDNSGNLVVKATGSKTTLYSINVTTLAVTTITTSVAIQGDDLAYSKGYFYSSFGQFLYKVGVSAGTTWTTTSSTIFPTNISGHQAAYSDGSGRVVFIEGNKKAYAVADPSTATASSNFSLIYTYATNPLDGAMCHAAPVPTANPDISSAGKNVAQTKDLLANDEVATNSSGVTLVASSVKLCDVSPLEVSPNCTKGAGSTISVANVGTYSVDASGVVTFTPVLDYLGTPPALNYQVEDSVGNIATSTYTPTVLDTLPTANNDTSSGPYNTNQIIDAVANDTAGSLYALNKASIKLCAVGTADNACLATVLDVPNEGIYSSNPDGTVTFDPYPSFKGQATPIKYTILDTNGQLATATITPSVTAPAVPVATSELKSVLPGGTVSFTTISGASGLATAAAGLNTSATCLITPGSNPAVCDSDGVVEISGQGTYTLNAATGVVTYVADGAVAAGNKTAVTYQVTDVTGQTASSTLTPVVPPAPTADNETSSGAYNTAQVIDVLTGDAAGAGATLVPGSVKLCATTSTVNASCNLPFLDVPNEGRYTVNANGSVTFVPLSSFTGQASLVKYVVADSTTQLVGATIQPTVAMPAPPTATANSQAVIPGGTVAFTTITGASGLASSVVGLNASLTCLITPGSSPESCDADGVVEVSGVGTYTLNKTTGVVTLVADPAATQGTKTALKYQVTDTFGQTATSTLTPVVPAPPDAVDDASSGPYNTSQVIQVLTNDLVTSPATLVPSSVKLCATTGTANASCNLPFVDVPNEGRYTANANGTVTFVPLSTFKGQASLVKYVVTDSTGQVTDALITVTVNNPGAPVAVNDTNIGPYDTVQAITILTNDTAGDAALPLLSSSIKLCPVAATAPFTTTNCSLAPTQAAPLVTADGSYWIDTATGKVYFDPLPTFTGQVTQPVRYVALDAFNQIATATITPEVTPPSLPTASPQSRVVVPGSSVSFTTITGPSGLATGVVLQTSGSTATCLYTPNTTSCELDNEVVIVGEGTFRLDPATGIVTFTAASNAPVGNRTAITYRVTDILGNSATSTLTPIVPPPATMNPDQSTNNWDTNQTLTPLSNDIATSGTSFVTSSLKLCAVGESSATGSCSLLTLTVANEGIYRVEANGSVVFDPLPTFTGTATTINYQVTDSYGRTAGSTITVIVTPPALPVATAQTKVVGPGLSVVFTNVIGSSALATGAALQTGSVNGPCLIDPANNSCVASLTIAGEGTWTIDRNSGVATFASLNTITPGTKTPVAYRVTDVLGNSTTSTLTPVVPEPPVVANDEKIDAWDTNQIFSPFANDKFASVAPVVMSSLKLCGSGESLGSCTRTVLSIENEGTYTVNSDGTVTFDPLPSFFGAATPVTYEAVDIAGQRLHATITPVVIAPPLPAATTDEVLGKKGRSVVFSPWLNDFAGTAPDNFIGNIKLVPSSIRLCGLGQLAPNCTLTKLTTADGKYSVDTKTGKVTFVPRTGFTGMVTQPVWYQIANDWKGASGVGISTAQLITTIEAGALPTTGLDFSAVLLLGGLTCGAGVGLWQTGKGRRRGDYELPRWLDEVDGE
jgi:CshA-type fibril repeat protein